MSLTILKEELELDFPELFDKIDLDLWTTGVGPTPVDGQSLFLTQKMQSITSLTKSDLTKPDVLDAIQKEPSIIKVAFIQHVRSLIGQLSDAEVKKIDEVC